MEQSLKHPYVARNLEKRLLELDQIPLLGAAPAFPWEQVLAALKQQFQLKQLEIEASPPKWCTADELYVGLNGSRYRLSIACWPIPSEIFCIMTEHDLSLLLTSVTHSQADPATLKDAPLLEGFYRFLAVEIFSILQKEQFPPGLTLRLGPLADQEPAISALIIDLYVHFHGKMIQSRLILPSEFLNGWKERFKPKRPETLSLAMAAEIEIQLGVNVGEVTLSAQEWKSVRPGDFVILDNCSLDLNNRSGRATLSLEGKPLFHAELSGQQLELKELL